MKLIEYHLKELTLRVLYLILLLISLLLIGYNQKEALLQFILSPIYPYLNLLIFTHPLEATWSHLKNSLNTATFLILPILALQFTNYITPSLYRYEKDKLIKLLIKSLLLFYLTSYFIFYYLWPISFHSLMNLETTTLKMEMKFSELSTFIFQLLILMNFNFIIPLLLSNLSTSILIKGRIIYILIITLTLSFISTTDKEFFTFFFITLIFYEFIIYYHLLFKKIY